jgi:hypothetical protein
MALYLTCGLCGRKQADGLLSRGYWGHLEGTPHGTLRACPTCKEGNSDWQSQVLAVATGGAATTYGVGQSGFAS